VPIYGAVGLEQMDQGSRSPLIALEAMAGVVADFRAVLYS
jgi:hypothetical protein